MTTADSKSKSLRDELGSVRRGPKSVLNDSERKERNKAQAGAAALAASVLKSRHKAEYDTLYNQAKGEMGID